MAGRYGGLTVGKTQAMFTALLRANTKRTHPLASATFQRIREVLRAALNGAIRRGLITQNPACWVEIPSASRPHAVVRTDARVAAAELVVRERQDRPQFTAG